MKNKIFLSFLLVCGFLSYGQIGIGTVMPNSSSMLEIVSNDKGVLISRVALTGTTDATTISNGNVESLLVYNTSTTVDLQPGYYFWSNDRWNRILTDGLGSFISQAANGLSLNGQIVELGGTLDKPTQIVTSATNTLAIQGMQPGSSTDNIVVIDPATGVLKSLPSSSIKSSRKLKTYTATQDQNIYTTPFPITDLEKVQVFRNGIEVNFTATVGNNSITIDFLNVDDNITSCFAGDEIKIFQWK